MTTKCRHLSISEEAYRQLPHSGQLVPIGVFLCSYVMHQKAAPRWLMRQAGSISIDPKSECVACPCFERQQESGE